MASASPPKKPKSEKQRLKLEKYAKKQEKQVQQAEHLLIHGGVIQKKPNKQDAPAAGSVHWLEETPPGQRKVLISLDENSHTAYTPRVVESAWYSFWEEKGLFKPQTLPDGSPKPRGTYVIAIPPPNVTGKLHIGHALALSLEDALIRWHRMQQFTTLYIPGCDHAGIATQAVVEKQLARNSQGGKSKRQDFTRLDFVQLCQEWKEDYREKINKTTRRLGASVDWSREAFTMSPQFSKAVTETFVRLHSEGLIYRANRLVHWSCRLSTALSTLEVDQKELEGTTKLEVPGYDRKIEFGTLTFFKYPIADSRGQTIEVATTRPETMLGDTAIAVHPQDGRYQDLVGKVARHPIVSGRYLKIISDDYVDQAFGTGAVKLTPAHDHDDFSLGKKHNLHFINILNEDGTLNEHADPFAGQKRFDARHAVVQELKALGLFTRQESHSMIVPLCSRSGDVIEPLLRPQWWMKMESMAKPAIEVVETGKLVIRPNVQRRQYLTWMRDIQDWCLSRQLWWGHQIPAYYINVDGELGENDANDEYWVSGRDQQEAQKKAEMRYPGKVVTLRRDEDVLDTWFSSGLWPFSILGWPDKTADFGRYFPSTTMETGWDIVPFWVSRMIMFSLKLTGQVPFTDVFCHGLIRDSDGRKMSKSLGNVIDPVDVIDGISLDGLHQKLLHGNLAQSEVKQAEKYQKKAFPQGIPDVGADALRFSLINYTQASGSDINFDIKTMHGYRRFCNKIHQATKYVLSKLGEGFVPRESSALTGRETLPEKWILTKMNTATRQINQALEDREFARSTQIVHRYLYDELFNIYIGNSKSMISGDTPEDVRSAKDTLYTTLETSLRLLSPFMPFLSEELWQRLPRRPGDSTISITISDYPRFEEPFEDAKSEAAYELVLGCSKGIRSLLAEYSENDGVVHVAPLTQIARDTASAQLSAILSLCGKIPVKIGILEVTARIPGRCAVFPVSADVNVYLSIQNRAEDAGKEVAKLRAKMEAARNDVAILDMQMSELAKVHDKDVSEAIQLTRSRKMDIDARLRALQGTLKTFEELLIGI